MGDPGWRLCQSPCFSDSGGRQAGLKCQAWHLLAPEPSAGAFPAVWVERGARPADGRHGLLIAGCGCVRRACDGDHGTARTAGPRQGPLPSLEESGADAGRPGRFTPERSSRSLDGAPVCPPRKDPRGPGRDVPGPPRSLGLSEAAPPAFPRIPGPLSLPLPCRGLAKSPAGPPGAWPQRWPWRDA